MDEDKKLDYSTNLRLRVLLIMEYSGLTLNGLSEITGISESHTYAILNGTKRITGTIAYKICKPFKMQGWQLQALDYDIPPSISKSSDLATFKKEYKHNIEYFSSTKNSSNASYFIEYVFINAPVFDSPAYVQDIISELHKINRNYASKDLSQILHYLVTKNKLNSEKRAIKLKNGGFGIRIVDVFFKP